MDKYLNHNGNCNINQGLIRIVYKKDSNFEVILLRVIILLLNF